LFACGNFLGIDVLVLGFQNVISVDRESLVTAKGSDFTTRRHLHVPCSSHGMIWESSKNILFF